MMLSCSIHIPEQSILTLCSLPKLEVCATRWQDVLQLMRDPCFVFRDLQNQLSRQSEAFNRPHTLTHTFPGLFDFDNHLELLVLVHLLCV